MYYVFSGKTVPLSYTILRDWFRIKEKGECLLWFALRPNIKWTCFFLTDFIITLYEPFKDETCVFYIRTQVVLCSKHSPFWLQKNSLLVRYKAKCTVSS